MTDKPRKRAPGGGRKPIYSDALKSRNMPMTEAQREKLSRLGGAAWVRAQIDAAPDPGNNDAQANSG